MILPTTFEPGQEATFTFRFCNKNILNIILSSSSMCVTNIIIALSYEFIWIIIEDDTGCFRMGKPN